MTDRRAIEGSFHRTMAAFGPFESCPHLAVAVSGGADSLALALLADHWARERGGRVTALTVDHGLRPDSRAEAGQVGDWLAARGISHRVLEWTGAKPATAVQARARAARHALLGDWCRGAGVLHLLMAHQRDDQAETMLLRLAGGSGPDGLAGMSAVAEGSAARVLRPLLAVSRAQIEGYLAALGQEWIEDPSNRDPRFARVRVRAGLPGLAREGITVATLAGAADRFAEVRAALEAATAALLARAVSLHPAGYAAFSLDGLLAAPAEIATRALARTLAAVGGRAHPPAFGRAGRALAALSHRARRPGNIAALAGCVIEVRAPSENGALSIWREARGLPKPEPLVGAVRLGWDGRFDVSVPASIGCREDSLAAGPLVLAPLGEDGWREAARVDPALRDNPIPYSARLALPALWDARGVARVPQLNYTRPGVPVWLIAAEAVFRPRRPLADPGFFVAPVA